MIETLVTEIDKAHKYFEMPGKGFTRAGYETIYKAKMDFLELIKKEIEDKKPEWQKSFEENYERLEYDRPKK